MNENEWIEWMRMNGWMSEQEWMNGNEWIDKYKIE